MNNPFRSVAGTSKRDGPQSNAELLTRRAKNAEADEKFKAAIGDRWFSIMATGDAYGPMPSRPETVIISASSMSYGESRERSH